MRVTTSIKIDTWQLQIQTLALVLSNVKEVPQLLQATSVRENFCEANFARDEETGMKTGLIIYHFSFYFSKVFFVFNHGNGQNYSQTDTEVCGLNELYTAALDSDSCSCLL